MTEETTIDAKLKQERDMEYVRNKDKINEHMQTLGDRMIKAARKSNDYIQSLNDSAKSLLNLAMELDKIKSKEERLTKQQRLRIEAATLEDKIKLFKSLAASVKQNPIKSADEEKEIVDMVKAQAAYFFYAEWNYHYYDKYESPEQAAQKAIMQTLNETIAQTVDPDKSYKKLYKAKTYHEILISAIVQS